VVGRGVVQQDRRGFLRLGGLASLGTLAGCALGGPGNGGAATPADTATATQGIAAQGLLWASELDGVDRSDLADDVVGYTTDELWDKDAGTSASGADDTFRTGPALYLANQDIWISNWAGDFYQGRGVPGRSDEPPN
jgi:hypothetical protein